ncbi:MAG: membrane protein insertion efficiency factor YidD [Eubacteriales bacterium]|nr:membrane protein insertion efficiency factor YidD [Eubacteriales bacterium]
MWFTQRLGIGLVRIYQRWISPLFPGSCRYHPTCSAYAIEAIRLHGLFKGGLLTIWRILRCNPFSKGGFDPVPGSDLERRLAAGEAGEWETVSKRPSDKPQ